jgi:Ligand-gated ion channel
MAMMPKELLILTFLLSHLLLQVVRAQQTPLFNIPNLSQNKSSSVRQNVCDRYLRYLDDRSSIRNALAGLQLHVGVRGSKFFNFRKGEGGSEIIDPMYPGVAGVLLDELAARAGFDWRQSYGIIRPPLVGTNQTYTDVLVWSTDFYDVSISWWDSTIERLKQGISFPEGFVDGSFIIVGVELLRQQEKINLWAWLRPFHWSVWLMIVITIFFSGCMYQLLENLGNSNRYKGRRTQDTFGNNLFLSTLLFTQHFQFQPRTPASRLFAASMALWALLISSAYTANLASYFVVQNKPTASISSIDDAIAASIPLCIWKGAAIHDFVKEQYPDALLIPKDEEIDVYHALNSGECRYGVAYRNGFDEFEKDKRTNPNCNLKW